MSREDERVPAKRNTAPALLRVLSLGAHYMKFNLRAGMEYRASFLVQVVGMVLNNSAFIVFWLILFERIGGAINGYEFVDVMFLWALAAAGYGLASVSMGNASQLSRLIYTGELDVYLLQPKPLIPNIVASRMSVTAWGDLVYGFLLFAITQPIRFSTVALFVVFTLLAAVLYTSIRIAYHSLTFFLGNAEDFASTASEIVLSLTIYPGSIFKGPIVWVLHSLVPAALLAYIPVRLIRRFEPFEFGLLVLADIAVAAVAVLLFHFGVRRYESGNRMGTRL